METYQIVFYAISAFLVLIATMQRSKNEETLKEYNILLLPLFTILGMLLIYAAIIYIPIDALNRILLVFFAVTGYYTTMINTFFLIEFTEYEIEENVLNNDMTDSEFSELSIKDKKRHKAKEDKRSIFTFFKSLYYSTKNAILRITLIDFLVYCFSASVVAAYVYTRNEILTEIISISICFTSIREIKIYSVVNGYTILTIYFIYDIIKLVYNDKMNNLTKDIDVPIKLVLPMTLHGYELVGFGDLLIPAFFIAICKKYGEDKEFRSVWYVSYISFCMGIVIGICLNWDRIDEIPMMLFVSPTVGITTLAYAAILDKTKDFLQYKRKSVKDK